MFYRNFKTILLVAGEQKTQELTVGVNLFGKCFICFGQLCNLDLSLRVPSTTLTSFSYLWGNKASHSQTGLFTDDHISKITECGLDMCDPNKTFFVVQINTFWSSFAAFSFCRTNSVIKKEFDCAGPKR